MKHFICDHKTTKSSIHKYLLKINQSRTMAMLMDSLDQDEDDPSSEILSSSSAEFRAEERLLREGTIDDEVIEDEEDAIVMHFDDDFEAEDAAVEEESIDYGLNGDDALLRIRSKEVEKAEETLMSIDNLTRQNEEEEEVRLQKELGGK